MSIPARRFDALGLVRLAVAGQLLLGLVGVAVWFWLRILEPDTPSPAVARGVVDALPAAIDSAYPTALDRARTWRSDARLLSASQQIDWPLGDPPPGPVTHLPAGGWLTYVFVSNWEHPLDAWDAVSLAITIERSGGTLILDEPLTWPDPPASPPPLLDTYPTTSTAAVLAAEHAGGTDFRRACPAVRHTTRVGLITDPTGPAWLVTYRDDRSHPTGDPNDLEFRIDTQTSQILSSTDRSTPCDPEP